MPPIVRIDLSDGLDIITSGNLPNISESTVQIEGRLAGVSGNLTKKENKFNEWLNDQEPFLVIRPLTDFPPEDPIRLGTTIGGEVVVGDEVHIRIFHVAVHIFEASPLRFTIKTSNLSIGGDWWL